MRCTQFIGLNERGKKYVEGKKILLYTDDIVRHHADGRIEHIENLDVYGEDIKRIPGKYEAEGLGETIAFCGYEFRDGSKVYEKVQEIQWSSGPMIFTCLVKENEMVIEETLWTDKEIDDEV
jgi:hypothetical protein